jgi:hypothetical protein
VEKIEYTRAQSDALNNIELMPQRIRYSREILRAAISDKST